MVHAKAYVGDIVFVTTDKITADKCKVVNSFAQFPQKVVVESLVSGNRYSVYPEWHCYNTEDAAIKAAEEYENGRKDVIY